MNEDKYVVISDDNEAPFMLRHDCSYEKALAAVMQDFAELIELESKDKNGTLKFREIFSDSEESVGFEFTAEAVKDDNIAIHIRYLILRVMND